jgi:hypothetical protein
MSNKSSKRRERRARSGFIEVGSAQSREGATVK